MSKDDYELEMITIAINSRKERIFISNVYLHTHTLRKGNYTNGKIKLKIKGIKLY